MYQYHIWYATIPASVEIWYPEPFLGNSQEICFLLIWATTLVYMFYYLAPTKPVFVGPKAEPVVRMRLSTLLKYKSDCTVFVKKKLYQAIEKTLSVVMIF